MSADTSLQYLLEQETAMRTGSTQDERTAALAEVINISLTHPSERFRNHARKHLAHTKNVQVDDVQLPVDCERPAS